MSGSAPGASGASVTRRMRPSAASCRRLKSSRSAPAHVLARVRAARAVLGRDVGPLHVDAGDGRVPRVHQRAGAGRELSSDDVMSVGRKRVTPVFSIASTARRTSSGGRRRVAEVDAGEPVDLQVDEAGQLQRP